jgi:hypothetical protein
VEFDLAFIMLVSRFAPRTKAFAVCVDFFIVISLRFAGELRPIVGGFDVPPWSAITRFWPLVWLSEQTAYQLP